MKPWGRRRSRCAQRDCCCVVTFAWWPRHIRPGSVSTERVRSAMPDKERWGRGALLRERSAERALPFLLAYGPECRHQLDARSSITHYDRRAFVISMPRPVIIIPGSGSCSDSCVSHLSLVRSAFSVWRISFVSSTTRSGTPTTAKMHWNSGRYPRCLNPLNRYYDGANVPQSTWGDFNILKKEFRGPFHWSFPKEKCRSDGFIFSVCPTAIVEVGSCCIDFCIDEYLEGLLFVFCSV